MKFWKLSLGTDYVNDSDYILLKDNKLVSLHPNTPAKGQSSESQGEAFLTAQKGDLFYVCRSNQSVEFIGMFIDQRPLYSLMKTNADWTDREYIEIAPAIALTAYNQDLDKWWTPKNNSTFTSIPDSDIKSFEENFLQPVFNKSYADIIALRDAELKKITQNFDDYSNLQKTFARFNQDEEFLFQTINDLSKLEIKKLRYEYLLRGDISNQPVVLLRSRIVEELMAGNKITTESINNLQSEITSGFEKNVFRAWKNPFRILYTLYYSKHKNELEQFFKHFIAKIQTDLEISDKTKINLVHFDGAQKQGDTRIWFAIYNKAFTSQKHTQQLFLNIENGITYGLLDYPHPENNDLHKVEKLDYNHLLQVFRTFKKNIVNDNSMEKAKIANYIELLETKKQIILQGPPGTGKTYTAKQIANQMLGELKPEQFQLVQFHPSYSYEDFVRGITAKNIEGQITYETEDKVFLEAIAKADLLKNNFLRERRQLVSRYEETVMIIDGYDENKPKPSLGSFHHLHSWFNEFKEDIEKNLKESEFYKVDSNINIEGIYENMTFNLRNHRGNKSGIIFTDLKNYFKNHFFGLNEKVASVQPYIDEFLKPLFKKFIDFIKASTPTGENLIPIFIFVIDEINRANLPSVLGELIYALEYRGEKVESMYAIDKNKGKKGEEELDASIVIPENLYIIGTMNTADRSVGHIDYAIRRRFAFESLLPSVDVVDSEKGKEIFKEVEKLFEPKYLSPDYKNAKTDVQIGHSYFMGEESDLPLRIKYEVIPILREYLKDGIFKETVREKIDELETKYC